MKKIKAVVIGGSGYVGGELIRLLLFHPYVELISVSSFHHIGKKVIDLFPNLNSITDMTFCGEELDRFSKEADVIFFALPHGMSMKKVPALSLGHVKIIDLAGDFRLKNKQNYEDFYKFSHSAVHLLDKFVYGLSEFYYEAIKQARFIACPGCFPTGAELALLPLALKGLLGNRVIVDAKTGSSGSGNQPSKNTHHPERTGDIKAYGLFTHRHTPEIKQEFSYIL